MDDLKAKVEQQQAQIVALREAMQEVSSLVEFYAKREMDAPANNQEAVRDTREKLMKFRKVLADTASAAAKHDARVRAEVLREKATILFAKAIEYPAADMSVSDCASWLSSEAEKEGSK